MRVTKVSELKNLTEKLKYDKEIINKDFVIVVYPESTRGMYKSYGKTYMCFKLKEDELNDIKNFVLRSIHSNACNSYIFNECLRLKVSAKYNGPEITRDECIKYTGGRVFIQPRYLSNFNNKTYVTFELFQYDRYEIEREEKVNIDYEEDY